MDLPQLDDERRNLDLSNFFETPYPWFQASFRRRRRRRHTSEKGPVHIYRNGLLVVSIVNGFTRFHFRRWSMLEVIKEETAMLMEALRERNFEGARSYCYRSTAPLLGRHSRRNNTPVLITADDDDE